MTKIALIGIAEPGRAELFDSSSWFEPFGLDPQKIRKIFLPRAMETAGHAVGCGTNRMNRPFPLPVGEPEGFLLTWPGARCGLAMLITSIDGGKALTAAWPFTTDGVEHEMKIKRILLAPDRLQAVVEGMIGGTLRLAWHDVLFPVDRAYYVEGSVHSVVLAGIAYRFGVGSLPPIKITQEAPSYAALRDMGPNALEADDSIMIRTAGLAAIYPIDNDWPTLFAIQGPVKRVEKYTGDLFDRQVLDVRVTVARVGDEMDDVDIAILVSDVVLGGKAPPKVGEDVSATILLQGRIWSPNVRYWYP